MDISQEYFQFASDQGRNCEIKKIFWYKESKFSVV